MSAICGTEVKDTFLPGIKAHNNLAEFTVSGGRNRFTVRIDGMTSIAGIKIEEKVGSSWSPYVTNVEAYDGYQITYNEDGTYSYFFVFEMDDVGSARTFKVTAK